MINGVSIIPLKKIPDERGMIMHMLREDDKHFSRFGEIYFSLVYPGIIKGWHLHKKMFLNYAVPCGMIKLVMYDAREESPSFGIVEEIFIGEHNYCLVQIPPGVYNGFKGIGDKAALVANCSSIPHDPEEISRLDPLHNEIPYIWDIVNK